MYILYTSGSTGEPKGVMVEHHSVSHYVDHAVRFYLSDVDGAVLSSPLCFDATVTALWSPLVAGKPLLLLSEEDPQELSSWLFGSTRGWLFRITPAHLEALFPFDRASAPSAAPHCLVLGGERLPAGTLSRWRALLPEAKFVNEYGPTETVVGSTAYEIGAHREYWPEQGADTVSIGQPIASTRVYVLNAHRQRVPPGVSGELHIGGVGVSRGYLHGPKLTAEKFVPDPFGATAGARLYRTGDLCRWRSDGSLEFLGRNDRQVKIRGYRIEPGEIETALTSLATVRSAVVVAQEQASGEKQLVAYVVLRASSGNHSGEPPPAGELQQSLREQLPHYMVPVSFVILDEMPLTAHGKIDRRRLPPAPDPVDSQAEIVPPGNPLEAALLRLWQRVLAVERVSTTTDFLALGGHSIQALRLVTLIRAATQVHVSLQEFMRLATVREVAAHIEKQRAMQPG
jgi:amino acid adenylation domain-containing protein